MLKALISASAALIVAVSAASAALAQEQDFTIINNTGYTVMTLNVSPASEADWGPDILGSSVLPDGEAADVSFEPSADVCLWDIRVTYDDGDTGDWRQINLCEVSTVTLN